MKRAVFIVVGVIALGVFAWIGWPRAEPGGAEADPMPTAGVVAPEPAASGEASVRDAPTATDEVDASEVGAGDAAATVTAEPEFDSATPGAPVVASWDDTVRTAAREAARATVTAFARAELEPEEWWAQLAPHLTLQAQPVYQDVDPRLVPVRAVTGEPTVTDESSALLAQVSVPTDVGDYTVLLVRSDGGAPWLAEQIRPPEQQ